jgi:DinB superfamily
MASLTSVRPGSNEYAPYYGRYVDQTPQGDVLEILEQGRRETQQLLGGLSEAKGAQRYEPGKWSIKGVVGHVTDAERVFAFRALWFARGDASPLPGWEQDDWARTSSFDALTLKDLLAGYDAQRDATLTLFRSLPADAWSRRGTASGNPVTVRALAWIAAGHERHHLKILRERYLKG